MKFIFWQNILSPHQAPFLRELAGAGHDVTIVTIDSMTDDRRGLGWKVPNMGCARLVIAPSEQEVRKLIINTDQVSIHIMAGARWHPLGNFATKLCRENGRRMGVITESPDPRGILGCGRWAKYAFERFTYGAHYDFILAMGGLGVHWFRRCGYSERKVFPFAYVVDRMPVFEETGLSDRLNSEISILFCGQFIHRKGLDVLLRAFARVVSDQTRLELLGDGALRSQISSLAQKLGLASRVVWLGKRDAIGVQTAMARSDITVLPSYHDGWGAVVNESLVVGTPVICSNACGASDLIRHPWLGSVFDSGDVMALTQCLKHWISSRSSGEREKIRQWSSCIQGDVVAQYFISIIGHVYNNNVRPEAPWRL